MKKIYSPLLEALLALYLGFEWIQVTYFRLLIDIGLMHTNVLDTSY